jgi:hypothetical protein
MAGRRYRPPIPHDFPAQRAPEGCPQDPAVLAHLVGALPERVEQLLLARHRALCLGADRCLGSKLLFVVLSIYGGGFVTGPAYLADMFGTKFAGAIHGRLLTAWSGRGQLSQGEFQLLSPCLSSDHLACGSAGRRISSRDPMAEAAPSPGHAMRRRMCFWLRTRRCTVWKKSGRRLPKARQIPL